MPIGRGNSLEMLHGFLPYEADKDFPPYDRERLPMHADEQNEVKSGSFFQNHHFFDCHFYRSKDEMTVADMHSLVYGL